MALLDLGRPDDAHTADRLTRDPIIWFGTVTPAGRPRQVPVWFLWNDPAIFVFTTPGTAKLRNLRANPAVWLSLESADGGNDIVLLEGDGELLDPSSVSAAATPGFGEKYGPRLGDQTIDEWSALFSQPIRVEVSKIVAWTKSAGGALSYRVVP